MNAKKFSDALSALDGRYVEEAARYRRKHGQSFWVRWGAAAACLCLLAAGGALLIQGRGRAAPDPQQVQIPNPILTVASAAEMEAYLDFKVPVLEKEVEAYSVFISDGYPTMGQVDYADGSQFRIQYGSGDISGIYGGTLEESREIAGVSVAYYQYDSMSYAIWEMIREWGRNRARPHSCVFSLPQQRQASGQPVHLMPGAQKGHAQVS